MTSDITLVDGHVHISTGASARDLDTIREYVGADRVCAVSLTNRETINENPAVFAVKAEFPDKFYAFGALDHSSYFSSGSISTPSLAEQVDRLITVGADGIKMLENKPTTRKELDIPVYTDYFEDYFARLEETQFPVLWHVADPEEFWDAEKTPRWAKDRGWGYDDTFVPKEQLYAEVERVLERHPKLRIIFAHFYFLSADLPRAASLLDRFDGVHLDLAPGIEYLYNMSKDPAKTHDFFERYSNRIVFGTDIWSSMSPETAGLRSGLVKRWLETDDEYRVPDGADFLLGPPEDGIIRGIRLSQGALQRIYSGNFVRLAGPKPRKLNKRLLTEER